MGVYLIQDENPMAALLDKTSNEEERISAIQVHYNDTAVTGISFETVPKSIFMNEVFPQEVGHTRWSDEWY